MPEKCAKRKKPGGWLRVLLRAPIYLYRWRLGWLLGNRFLLLHHLGRLTGRPRTTVLEVVRYDRAADQYIVAAGFGDRSDWLLNLARHPQAGIQVGRRFLKVQAVRLPADQAGDELADYNRRHPAAFRTLASLLGYQVDGSEADARKIAAYLPVVGLQAVREP